MSKMKIQSLLVIAVRCFLFTATENDVQIPPMIKKSPDAHVIYRSGTLLLLDCKAEGSPNVRYTWTKNGVELKEHTNSYIPHVLKSNATADDEGIYQCAASNEYGTAISDKSHVQMAYIKVTVLGRDEHYVEEVTVTEGQPVSISAPLFESVPKAELLWWSSAYEDRDRNVTYSPEILEPSKRIQIDENGELHLAYAVPEDELLRFLPIYRYNSRLYFGNHTDVTAVKAGNNPVEERPRVRYHDEPSVALLDRNVSFRCIFSGYPYPKITWTLPGNVPLSLRHQLNFDGTQLLIVYVRDSDKGKYICSASNINGEVEHNFQIRVEAVPSFNRKDDRPHNIDAIEGTTVTFVCDPYAKPEALMEWFYNGKLIDVDSPPRRFEVSYNRRSLTISNVCRKCSDRDSKTDLMVIQCNASNVHGYAFASGYLNVIARPTCEEAMYVPWWVVLVSTLSLGALLLLVGLFVGLRCKQLKKNSVVRNRNQAAFSSRTISDSLYDVVREEAIDMQRVSRPMANTWVPERQAPRPLVCIPERYQQAEPEHEYYPKMVARSPSGSDDYTPIKEAPHYLTMGD